MARKPHIIEIPFVIDTTVEVEETALNPHKKGVKVVTPVNGATVTIVHSAGGAPVKIFEKGGEHVISEGTTATTLTNSSGQIIGWLEEGAYEITVSGGEPEIAPKAFSFNAVSGEGVEHISESQGTEEGNGVVTFNDLVTAVREQLVQVGSLIPYAGSTVPSGYLPTTHEEYTNPKGEKEGTEGEYLTTKFPKLSAVCGVKFGTAVKPGYFVVPDMRGRVPVGADPNRVALKGTQPNILGEKGGASEVKLTIGELAEHKHKVPSTSASVSGNVTVNGVVKADEGYVEGEARSHTHIPPSGQNSYVTWSASANHYGVFNKFEGEVHLVLGRGEKMSAIRTEYKGSLATTDLRGQEIGGCYISLPSQGLGGLDGECKTTGSGTASVIITASGANYLYGNATLEGSNTLTGTTGEVESHGMTVAGGENHENMQPYTLFSFAIKHD